MENSRLMTHDELLQELDAIVYFKTDPPAAYDCAHVHGTIYEPLAQPAFPHDRPYWVRVESDAVSDVAARNPAP
jgi:hypothetical protein